jgi:hypothetical protein
MRFKNRNFLMPEIFFCGLLLALGPRILEKREKNIFIIIFDDGTLIGATVVLALIL